jgi:hypothetical protein
MTIAQSNRKSGRWVGTERRPVAATYLETAPAGASVQLARPLPRIIANVAKRFRFYKL